jgi:hypothetical protein
MNLGMSMHTDDDMPSASTSPPSSLAASSGLSRTPRSLSSRSLSEVPMQDTPRPIMESLGPWPTFDPNTVHSSMLSNASDGSNASHASDVSASISHEHEDPYDPVLGTVALLERLIDHPARVRASSTAAFFEWRPSPLPNLTTATPLTGPSTSPASSTFEGAGPMPTVARAQGGGEWEATLSRRLAHRRELDAAAAAASAVVPRGARRGRGARRRRSHSPPSKMPCPTPLFPRRPAAVSLGLADLLDAAFAPVRRVVRSPWNVVFACALAVAVGCGIWAVRAQGAAA